MEGEILFCFGYCLGYYYIGFQLSKHLCNVNRQNSLVPSTVKENNRTYGVTTVSYMGGPVIGNRYKLVSSFGYLVM